MKWRLAGIALMAVTVWAQPPGGPGGPPPGGPPGAGPGGAMGDGVWQRNAAFGELETFDLCNGHQPGTGMYHHHINPVCLRAQLSDNVAAVSTGRLGTQYTEQTANWTHSPILGWAFDGYPVYGPYGYSDPTDPTSDIIRVRSGFQLRNITQRHTLPDWVLPYHSGVSQNLTSSQYGPDVSQQYPLGRYVEDYDYVAGSGDLDQYNGRVTVTPDYPNGTYAYFVTLDSNGAPVFPFIINVQLNGMPAPVRPTVPGDAVDYFNSGALTQAASNDPQLASWYTNGSQQDALAITGYDPSAGPSTTWPTNAPSGANVMGGAKAPALADTQRIRYDSNAVYVSSNNLPSYTIGPWFEASMPGGVFMNFASPSSQVAEILRSPTVAVTKSASGMGPVGMWVNGVAIFNTLDGGSYSNAVGADAGGGGISTRATHFSMASKEHGPLAAGSLASAKPEFNAVLATSTEAAPGPAWPITLGGATVTVTDSTGAQLPAGILYASPNLVNYQIPSTAAPGFGRVTITANGVAVTGTVNIVATYPGLFTAASPSAIDLSSGPVNLTLLGTGIETAPVTAAIGGVNVAVSSAASQAMGPGYDQVVLTIPISMAGKGAVNVVVMAAGKPSNPVSIVIQ